LVNKTNFIGYLSPIAVKKTGIAERICKNKSFVTSRIRDSDKQEKESRTAWPGGLDRPYKHMFPELHDIFCCI
jgi:hypothetical protein